jgi:hypothetical protein
MPLGHRSGLGRDKGYGRPCGDWAGEPGLPPGSAACPIRRRYDRRSAGTRCGLSMTVPRPRVSITDTAAVGGSARPCVAGRRGHEPPGRNFASAWRQYDPLTPRG